MIAPNTTTTRLAATFVNSTTMSTTSDCAPPDSQNTLNILFGTLGAILALVAIMVGALQLRQYRHYSTPQSLSITAGALTSELAMSSRGAVVAGLRDAFQCRKNKYLGCRIVERKERVDQ
ncbi:hypothetical protein LTR17_023880 [Elasticomyces elasticus]|nr:hypothetical protein LTR17_023880 [Elasticomyces elasticus]